MNEKILIVDDQKKMVKMLKTCLEKEGYSTVEAYDGEEALEQFRLEQPDLVLLDVMMPRLDGLEFCRRVREKAKTPIIIISAKSEETDKLVGLDLGADDYITKPFSLREMVARVRSLLRRVQNGAAGADRVVEGPLVIDSKEHSVEVEGVRVSLTPTEFDMLLTLAAHPGRVFSRRQLIESAQGDFFEGYERTVDAHIGNIRKKINENAGEKNLIETVYGVGYRYKA
jgi:two-component system, OmpR family, alkaline phosphatase synthesis response regulator PhoP